MKRYGLLNKLSNYKNFTIGFIFIGLFIGGCGTYIRTIVKMRPMRGIEEYKVSEFGNSVTVEKDTIKITVTYYDMNRLEGLSKSISTNPYINETKALFTIFNIEIENLSEDKISFDPVKCVVLDGLGNQNNGLTIADFERFYPTTSTQGLSYSYVFQEYTPTVSYTNDYYKRKTAGETMLKGGDLYPKVKAKGLLVFEPVKQEAKEVNLIVPSIIIYKGNEAAKKLDFSFHFVQEVHLQGD